MLVKRKRLQVYCLRFVIIFKVVNLQLSLIALILVAPQSQILGQLLGCKEAPQI